MKIVELSEAKKNLSEYVKAAQTENVVITRNGKPAALLSKLDEEDLFDYQFLSDPRVKAEFQRRQKDCELHGGIPIEEVRKRLHLTPFKPKQRNSKRMIPKPKVRK